MVIGIALVTAAGIFGGLTLFGSRPSHTPHPRVLPMLRNLVPVPAAGEPILTPMTYDGGQVEVTPKVYLVFWGWSNSADPAATQMQQFVSAIGGTPWSGINTQYYEQVNGQTVYITNPAKQLAGVWFDNVNTIHDNLSGNEIAAEALRGAQHFGISDFADSNIVVAQPANANDVGFNTGQYCAWHDWSTDGYTLPAGSPHFAFTSMPYVLNAGANCGKDFVNAAPGGDLDGVSIVLGHEIAEGVTDPGAGTSQNSGWLDLNGDENGDKCAWMSLGPGSATDITGNDGRRYAVQGLWDNGAMLGLGYCRN
jgi:serine protease